MRFHLHTIVQIDFVSLVHLKNQSISDIKLANILHTCNYIPEMLQNYTYIT